MITDRQAEHQKKNTDGDTESSNVFLTQTVQEEQGELGECLYLSKKRPRLALLDVLIETAENDPSLTLSGIQEEVDNFMFAVGLNKNFHHFRLRSNK